MKFKPPVSDINAPDLYIPLMGFLTYCLLCCLADVMSVPSRFKPEVRASVLGRVVGERVSRLFAPHAVDRRAALSP